MKRSFIQLVILAILSIYNAMCVVTGGVHLKKLVPTGVITQGILGGFSGKVGPVVGGSWKGIDYMRGYVVPANPNTSSQQAQRTKFGIMVGIGRTFLASVLNTFWDPFAVQMSGFNAFIKENINKLVGDVTFMNPCVVSKGTLESANLSATTYNNATGDVVYTWDGTPVGNGLITDIVDVLVYDNATDTLYYESASASRQDGTYTFNIDSGLSFDTLGVAIIVHRGTGEEFIVADGICVDPTEA